MIDDILGNGGFIAQRSTEIKYLYRYWKGLDIHIYMLITHIFYMLGILESIEKILQ